MCEKNWGLFLTAKGLGKGGKSNPKKGKRKEGSNAPSLKSRILKKGPSKRLGKAFNLDLRLSVRKKIGCQGGSII